MLANRAAVRVYDLKTENDRIVIDQEIENFENNWKKLKRVDLTIVGIGALTSVALATQNLWLILAAGASICGFLAGKLVDERKPTEKDFKEQLEKLKIIYAQCLQKGGVEATKDELLIKLLNCMFMYIDTNKKENLEFLFPRKLRTQENLRLLTPQFKAVFAQQRIFTIDDFITEPEAPAPSYLSLAGLSSFVTSGAEQKIVELKEELLPKYENPCKKLTGYLKKVGSFAVAQATPKIYGEPLVADVIDEKAAVSVKQKAS